jgi:hypothetical protein
MDQSDRYAFVEFTIRDEAAFDRLAIVTAELLRQKNGEAIRDEDHWLPYFAESDRAEFWWPTQAETELWNKFWFSTPLPDRHSPEMPTPPWDFGSMVDAIMDGEYDLMGVRKLTPEQARFEFDPHAYPYGGIGAARALVRSFGHTIIGFDDGTGFTSGDPQAPRWSADMPPFKRKNPSVLDHFKGR